MERSWYVKQTHQQFLRCGMSMMSEKLNNVFSITYFGYLCVKKHLCTDILAIVMYYKQNLCVSINIYILYIYKTYKENINLFCVFGVSCILIIKFYDNWLLCIQYIPLTRQFWSISNTNKTYLYQNACVKIKSIIVCIFKNG